MKNLKSKINPAPKIWCGINWNSPQIFDFAIEILILIVVFIMPTIFDRRLGIVFSGTKTTWMRVFGSVIFGVWAIKLIIFKKHRFIRTPLDWPILSFLLCTTVATLTSIHVYTSFAGFYGRYEGLTSWYLFFLFFFVITNYIKNFEQLKRIIITVMSAATLKSIYSIIQRHALDPYMWGGVPTKERVIGMIGQPNFLAAYMLMAFFLILGILLMERKAASAEINWADQLVPLGYFFLGQIAFLFMIYNLEAQDVLLWYFAFSIITASAILFTFSYEKLHPWIFNLLLGLSLILIYISILYTQSRGGYMGFFTGAVLFAIIAGRQGIFANWKKISVLGFLIILVSGITMSRPEYSPFERFSAEVKTEKVEKAEKVERKLELGGAAGSRGETWKSAFRIIADYPIFGIGPEVLKMVFPRYETDLFRFKEAFHVKQDRCHNEIFDVGVTKGLVAFLVYLWLLFTFFRVGFKKAKAVKKEEKLMLAGLLGGALAFLIQNQFSFGVVAITSLFWMMWGMVMVIGEEGRGEREEGRRFSWLEIPWLPAAGVIILALFLIYVSFFSFRGDVWFKSGKTKIQMGRIPQAAEDFEKSLKVFPFEGGTVSHLGIAQLNLSRLSPEKNFLNKAISTLKYGTQIDPYNADNFYMLSKIYLMLGNLPEAQKNAEIALKIDPYYAEVYQTLAMIYERQSKFKEAASYFEKSFLINPNLTEPMQSLENLCKPSEALMVFERALHRYSDNLPILERVARLNLKQGRPGMALENYKKMIGLDPKNVTAYTGLGNVYLALGNRRSAKNAFEQAFMLDPNNTFAREMFKKLK